MRRAVFRCSRSLPIPTRSPSPRTGFETSTTTGISVFADQVQTLRIPLQASLRTIARVTARSSMDVVKSGTTTDVYSVNATVTQAAAGIGGGGNLNNAYSAIAAVPGAFVPPNQQGWDQTVYIRGGNYDQIGYEFDGVPGQPFVRQLSRQHGRNARAAGASSLYRRRNGRIERDGLSRLHQSSDQDRNLSGIRDGGAAASARRRTITTSSSKSAERRPTASSPTTSASGATIRTTAISTSSTVRISATSGATRRSRLTLRISISAESFQPAATTAPSGQGWYYDGPNPSPIYDPFTLNPGQTGYVPLPVNTLNRRAVGNDPGCYQTISPAYRQATRTSRIAKASSICTSESRTGTTPAATTFKLLYNVTALQSQFYSSQNDLGPHVITELSDVEYGRRTRCPRSGAISSRGRAERISARARPISPVPYFAPGSPGNRCANIDPYGFYGQPTIKGQCPAGTFSAVPPDSRD